MRDRTDLRWRGHALHLGEHLLLTIVPDDRWPGMWRIADRDGALSDMVNIDRAKDAAEDAALSGVNSKGGNGAAEGPPVRFNAQKAPSRPDDKMAIRGAAPC